MGIINTTPDSFSDGGKYLHTEAAFTHALELAEQGADILDIGGESTRPGAAKVPEQEEMDRVIPVIERLSMATDVPISIDTSKPQLMTAAVAAGASMINDINGLRAAGSIKAVVKAGVPVCIMHMRGEPQTMQNTPDYGNVTAEVIAFLAQRIDACLAAGMDRQAIIVDPGIGFGKSLAHNLSLLADLAIIRAELECNVLVGISRKSMIDKLLGRVVEQRLSASLGLAVQALLNGAKIIRVHDVQATIDAIRSVEAVLNH